MGRKIELDFTPEIECIIERIRKEVPADDVYGYMIFLIEKMSDFTHQIYDMDPELYTEICLNDEDNLLFLNILSHLEKVSRGL